MPNPYQTKTYKIIDIKLEAPGVKLFSLTPAGKGTALKFKPGQIIEVSMPGFGEAPFAPCPSSDSKDLQLCIRKVGLVTNKLHLMKIGDKVGIRGPYGNGWPENCHPERSASEVKDPTRGTLRSAQSDRIKQNDGIKRNLLIVVGGLGLIPLRYFIWNKDKFLGRDAKIQIFYGARTLKDFLFKSDFDDWRKMGVDLQLTIDKKCPGWSGCIGVVTKLFDQVEIIKNARAFLCGPPIMYRFVLEKLKEHGFADKDIFLSLERRMHCGIGICQHCAIGPYYVCKDGPAFQYDKIKDIKNAI